MALGKKIKITYINVIILALIKSTSAKFQIYTNMQFQLTLNWNFLLIWAYLNAHSVNALPNTPMIERIKTAMLLRSYNVSSFVICSLVSFFSAISFLELRYAFNRISLKAGKIYRETQNLVHLCIFYATSVLSSLYIYVIFISFANYK